MIYIHNSNLSVHGRLKSSNCLVDKHWILRITDFGPERFLEQQEDNDVDDDQKYKSEFIIFLLLFLFILPLICISFWGKADMQQK